MARQLKLKRKYLYIILVNEIENLLSLSWSSHTQFTDSLTSFFFHAHDNTSKMGISKDFGKTYWLIIILLITRRYSIAECIWKHLTDWLFNFAGLSFVQNLLTLARIKFWRATWKVNGLHYKTFILQYHEHERPDIPEYSVYEHPTSTILYTKSGLFFSLYLGDLAIWQFVNKWKEGRSKLYFLYCEFCA